MTENKKRDDLDFEIIQNMVQSDLGLNFSPETIELIIKAREVHNQHFPRSITYDYPAGTPAISLTGPACGLNCAHCGGHYLESMLTPSEAKNQLRHKAYQSCLISGGCDILGAVNSKSDTSLIQEIKSLLAGRQAINMHVGLIEGEEIDHVLATADIVSYDIVGDDATISEVYGTDKKTQDYEELYLKLKKQIPVAPHICIGLRGGEIGHEYPAIDILKRHRPDSLVFIVFIPTKGTSYADREPPNLEETVRIICQARIDLPETVISLGCMRPRGTYRAQLDYLAILAGINRLVMPTPQARKLCEKLNYKIEKTEECCVL